MKGGTGNLWGKEWNDLDSWVKGLWSILLRGFVSQSSFENSCMSVLFSSGPRVNSRAPSPLLYYLKEMGHSRRDCSVREEH